MRLKIKEAARRIVSRLPEPKYTRLRNQKLFEWMNQNARGKRVLNLGSGVGQFDNHLSKEIELTNLDIARVNQNLDVIGDAHDLPFKSESFDIVYSIAVLEHVRWPWIVADEILRVLCRGGHVVLELPFLNVIHDERDYFRFTDKGIRALFDEKRFSVIFEQVSAGGGSFLSVFVLEYFEQFVPTKHLKFLWRICMRYFFCLFRYLDVLIDTSQHLRKTANSFSMIGEKK
jgi:ubiquinone/menaquinone biosynthesis C-methylase UbiE